MSQPLDRAPAKAFSCEDRAESLRRRLEPVLLLKWGPGEAGPEFGIEAARPMAKSRAVGSPVVVAPTAARQVGALLLAPLAGPEGRTNTRRPGRDSPGRDGRRCQ